MADPVAARWQRTRAPGRSNELLPLLTGGRLSLDESTGRSERLVEDVAQDGVVGGCVAEQASASVDLEVRGPDDQERQAVGWDLRASTVVVDAALLAAVDAADREPFWLVEVRDGVVVLALVHLDHEVEVLPEGIDGQRARPAGRARVAPKPVESVFPQSSRAEERVDSVEDVAGLVVSPSPSQCLARGLHSSS